MVAWHARLFVLSIYVIAMCIYTMHLLVDVPISYLSVITFIPGQGCVGMGPKG